MAVPEIRIEPLNRKGPRASGDFVLYWMNAARRVTFNFALQHAVGTAVVLGKPLLIVEPLACGGRWDNERHHVFALEGMLDNAARLSKTAAQYCPLVEQTAGESDRVLVALAGCAAAVIADDHPARGLSKRAVRSARRCGASFEIVDSNGLLPVRAAEKVFSTAHSFRRFLQAELPKHLAAFPAKDPLRGVRLARLRRPPKEISRRTLRMKARDRKRLLSAVADLPVAHHVRPVAKRGGATEAARTLRRFLRSGLTRYAAEHSEPEADATSGLSPYLAWGHISVHEVFRAVARKERWSPRRLGRKASGKKRGWWGMSEDAEAFLDELVTWRELGYNMCSKRDDFDRWESLPFWARSTLEKHASDSRAYKYALSRLETAQTHDRLWNAAQGQLIKEGVIHNYLRMLWGKKILEWTATPKEALSIMIDLNNKFAIDGRDPNSYTGIFWVLGRYDRPWGPERPIFGKIRYMTSESTMRKLHVKDYIASNAPIDTGTKRAGRRSLSAGREDQQA